MPKSKLAIRADEDPWTAAETEEVRTGLHSELERLRAEVERATTELRDLMREGVDGAGNDDADIGSKSIERDAGLSLAENHHDLLDQTQKALDRLAAGTYGVCESCGEPVGKMRLLAFPRATLCMTCKQREERR